MSDTEQRDFSTEPALSNQSNGVEMTENNKETPKIYGFFHRIAVLALSKEEKNTVAQEIVDESKASHLYRIQLIISVIITTLGLLTNSAPVVIGGMIIAPILRPIQAFAFATSTGNKSMYARALNLLFFSAVIAVVVAYVITMIVPFAQLTEQVLTRTTPTTVDLFIALASGVIAILALGYKRLLQSIAGVAMASALVPPLCVIGVGLQFLRFDIAQGSTLLFLANLIAIIVVGVIMFYLFGFFPTNKKGQQHSFSRIGLIFVTVALIAAPLWSGLQSVAEEFRLTQTIRQTTNQYIANLDERMDIDMVTYQTISDGILRVNAVVNTPDTTLITPQERAELTQQLAVATQNSVQLDLRLVEIASVYIDEAYEPTIDEKIIVTVETLLTGEYANITLLDSKTAYDAQPIILLSLFVPDQRDVQPLEDLLTFELEKLYAETSTILRQWQRPNVNAHSVANKPSADETLLHDTFRILSPETHIDTIRITETAAERQIYVYITTSESPEDMYAKIRVWKEQLQQYRQKKLVITTDIMYVDTQRF